MKNKCYRKTGNLILSQKFKAVIYNWSDQIRKLLVQQFCVFLLKRHTSVSKWLHECSDSQQKGEDQPELHNRILTRLGNIF